MNSFHGTFTEKIEPYSLMRKRQRGHTEEREDETLPGNISSPVLRCLLDLYGQIQKS